MENIIKLAQTATIQECLIEVLKAENLDDAIFRLEFKLSKER